MSIRRNRSIRTLPLENLTLLKHPIPKPSNEKLIFGEEILRNNSPVLKKSHILSSDDSLDNILHSFQDLNASKSSSSSLSWGDEYKSDTSKQVHDELERMDRILRGLESIPPNYDEEEYKEWMEFFPNLCILGTSFGTHIEHLEQFNMQCTEEIVAIDPENDCDKVESTHQIKIKIKKAVIDQIYQKIANTAPKLTLDVNSSIDIDNYLKVSPLGGSSRERFIRRRSSRSLISSHISSSKWLKEDNEYNSLPFMVGGLKSNQNVCRKGILKNHLVLPPIETSQFRSISATPRRESKSLSALSVNDRIKDRIDIPTFFVCCAKGKAKGQGENVYK